MGRLPTDKNNVIVFTLPWLLGELSEAENNAHELPVPAQERTKSTWVDDFRCRPKPDVPHFEAPACLAIVGSLVSGLPGSGTPTLRKPSLA